MGNDRLDHGGIVQSRVTADELIAAAADRDIADGFCRDMPDAKARAADGVLDGYSEDVIRVGTDRMLDAMFGGDPIDGDGFDDLRRPAA